MHTEVEAGVLNTGQEVPFRLGHLSFLGIFLCFCQFTLDPWLPCGCLQGFLYSFSPQLMPTDFIQNALSSANSWSRKHAELEPLKSWALLHCSLWDLDSPSSPDFQYSWLPGMQYFYPPGAVHVRSTQRKTMKATIILLERTLWAFFIMSSISIFMAGPSAPLCGCSGPTLHCYIAGSAGPSSLVSVRLLAH